MTLKGSIVSTMARAKAADNKRFFMLILLFWLEIGVYGPPGPNSVTPGRGRWPGIRPSFHRNDLADASDATDIQHLLYNIGKILQALMENFQKKTAGSGRVFQRELAPPPAVWYNILGAAVSRRSATSLRKGVVRMGDGRGTQVLRYLVCFIIALLLMIYISPKAY